jgi:hypothetical protein
LTRVRPATEKDIFSKEIIFRSDIALKRRDKLCEIFLWSLFYKGQFLIFDK